MYIAHIYLDCKLVSNRYLAHAPTKGDTVRFGPKTFGVVSEVIFILDENNDPGTVRINIRVDSLAEEDGSQT